MNYSVTRTQLMEFYDRWAANELGNCYDARVKVLAWKAHLLADAVPRPRQIDSILEVGCAEGRVLKGVAEYLGSRFAVGIDISPRFIQFATKCFPDISFCLFDGEKLPFLDKSFDVVLCSDVLEHIVDLEQFLGELRRVGRATLFKIPIEKSWLTTFRQMTWQGSGTGLNHPEGHFHQFTHRDAMHLLNRQSFQVRTANLVCVPIEIRHAYTPPSEWNRHPSPLAQRILERVAPQLCIPAFGGALFAFCDNG